MVIRRLLERVRKKKLCQLDLGIVNCGIPARDELMQGQC
jgi:hypothetical protein